MIQFGNTAGLNTAEGTRPGIGRKYRHYKGNDYLVLHLAKDSETLEEVVVYQALYGERGVWVRPLKMFGEFVQVNGVMVKRFTELDG